MPAIATVTYHYLDADLISDLGSVVGVVGGWFTSNALLAMILTVSACGLAIALIKKLKGSIM